MGTTDAGGASARSVSAQEAPATVAPGFSASVESASVTPVREVLSAVKHWPVGHVAGFAFGAAGQVAVGDQDRVFRLASVSKLVTALAVLLGVQEGALELDGRVPADLVPDWPGDSPTVRELLAHASGMGFAAREPQREPRSRRIYSSAGYEVLADALSAATDMSFAEYVSLGICQPLGVDIDVSGSAGHGFSASVNALAVLAQELVEPRLIAPELLDAALQPQFPQLDGVVPGYGRQRPCPWGLGFELHGEKSPHWLGANMPPEVGGHFGQAGTFLWVHPGSGCGAVVLTDRDFGPWAKDLWAEFNAQLWEALGN